MGSGVEIVERTPTIAEYYEICKSVGWEDFMNFDAAVTSLENSVFCVVAVRDGQTIGMGRIIGDGAIYFYIQDIAVIPDYQGQGVGTAIMARLMAYLRENAPDKSFIGLFAAEGTKPFYQQYTFDTYPALTGMFTVVNRAAHKAKQPES